MFGVNRNTSVPALLTDIKECSKTRSLESGKQIHAQAVECGHIRNIFVANALVNMYAKCSSMLDAQKVFDSMDCPDVVAWNALILGYADNGQGQIALELFRRMRNAGPAATSITFLAALKACTSLAVKEGASKWMECRERGKEIHELVTEKGSDSNVKVQSTLIEMYAKCGSMVDARQVFDRKKHSDVVSWNTLILGYADNGQGLNALDLFTRMKREGLEPDCVSFLAALKACGCLALEGIGGHVECSERGKEIHDLVIENGFDLDIKVQNTLIDMYAKSGRMVEARQVFNSITHPTVVSWNALITGCADNGQGLTALDLFTRMKNAGPAPSSVTFLAVLKACGMVGGLEFGRRIYSEIDKSNSLTSNLVTCLVDFYARCGSLEEARSIFEAHVETRDLKTWTALLAGFSSSGDHGSVFALFDGMQDAGCLPDAVTLLCVLTCCSHEGLVEKGKECFDEIPSKYGIAHTIEHYNCMVDLLGRSNKLDDALALLERMPYSPDKVSWKTVLSACRKWRNVEVARLAFQSLINLSNCEAVAYVLMGQVYGSRGMLQEQEMVMAMRREMNGVLHPSKRG